MGAQHAQLRPDREPGAHSLALGDCQWVSDKTGHFSDPSSILKNKENKRKVVEDQSTKVDLEEVESNKSEQTTARVDLVMSPLPASPAQSRRRTGR